MTKTRGTTVPANAPGVWVWRVLGIVICLAILPLSAASAGSVGPLAAVVRPDPTTAGMAVGDTVTVNIYVQDVADLYGIDVRLGFDPAILEVQDADPVAAGVQIAPLSSFLKPDFLLKKEACNAVGAGCPAAGTVWYAATQVNPTAPASGSGPVAAVTFKRIAGGSTTVAVTSAKLVTRSGATIPSTPQNGTIVEGAVVYKKLFLPLVLR